MLMNPSAQDKAQEEIDRVIGTDRLPTFDDEPKLPYVSALAKEVFRWQQVAPFGTQFAIACGHGWDLLGPLCPSDPTSFNGR
jgi:Cytochrome P450